MPKVSVLVPLYNTDENHLKEMIDSVLNQTFREFELLLLNDSPTNNRIRQVVDSYSDVRIRYLENSENLGISASRNKLLEMARGEYLAIFDHDDICLPNRLELQVAYMDEHPEVGVCSGWAIEIPRNRVCKYPEKNGKIKQGLMDGCCVLHPSAMLRKSTLINNNIHYEAEYSPAEDYMLWIRLMGVTMFHNIQTPLIKYRNHLGNTSHRQKERMIDKDAMIKCVALRDYSYLMNTNKKKSWIYLFDLIPFIKVKTLADKKSYMLFGLIPLLSRK